MTANETALPKNRPVASFFVLTYVLSYVVGVVIALVLQFALPPSLRDSSDIFAKYGPTFAGLIMAWVVAGQIGIKKLLSALLAFRVHFGWYAFALLIPFAAALASIAVFSVTGGELQTAYWNSTALTSAPFLIPTKVFLGGGLGEELGWRGFALPQLQGRMSAFKASLIIWIVWSVWHYPAFALASDRDGEMPILMFTVFVLAVTIILTWIYNSTGGNLLIPVLFHGTANASEHLFEVLVPVTERASALWWLTAFYCLIAILVVVIYRGESLSPAKKVVWSSNEDDRA